MEATKPKRKLPWTKSAVQPRKRAAAGASEGPSSSSSSSSSTSTPISAMSTTTATTATATAAASQKKASSSSASSTSSTSSSSASAPTSAIKPSKAVGGSAPPAAAKRAHNGRRRLGRGRVAQAQEEEEEEEEKEEKDEEAEEEEEEKEEKVPLKTKVKGSSKPAQQSCSSSSKGTSTGVGGGAKQQQQKKKKQMEQKEDEEEAELPTQLDVPLLLGGSTQLDELPTQIDLPTIGSSDRPRSGAKKATKKTSESTATASVPSTRLTTTAMNVGAWRRLDLPSSPSSSPSPSPGAGRSPSLSPNPYHMLMEEATQTDSPQHWPQSSLPSSPRSPAFNLDSPTQHDGPRSPYPLSPVASPLRADRSSLPSSPIMPSSKRIRRNKTTITTTTTRTTSVYGSAPMTDSQRYRLMSQPTQPDLLAYSPSPSSQSQGDSSLVYDDYDNLLGKATQADCEIGSSPTDLLLRPTQNDYGESTLSPIRRSTRQDKRAKLGSTSPARPSSKRGSNLERLAKASEDASPDTSLLLLDTSTQDDDVDYALEKTIGEDDASESESEISSWEHKQRPSKRQSQEPSSLESSFASTPTQDDRAALCRAPTQADLNISTQTDQSLVLDAEGEGTIGSIPTQADCFALLPHSHGDSTLNLPTQMDLPTQIDSIPTQCDIAMLQPTGGHSSQDKKAKPTKASGIEEAATLVEPLVYDPTPPLADEESPGYSAPNKSKKRKIDDGTQDGKNASTKQAVQRQEPLRKAEKEERKRSEISKPGFGDHQDELEVGSFGKLISLNPKFPSVVIPEKGVLMGRHSSCHPSCRFAKNTHISTKHCQITVVQRSPSSQSAGEESNDGLSLELAPEDAPLCKYGPSCYRKNPAHFKEFRHPPKAEKPSIPAYDIEVEDMSTNGTYINGNIIGKGSRSKLQDGDELSLVLPVAQHADASLDLIAYRLKRK